MLKSLTPVVRGQCTVCGHSRNLWVKEVGEGVACSHAAEHGCTGTMEAVYTGPKKFIPAELLAGGCSCAQRKARENEAALRAGAPGATGNEAEVPSPEPEAESVEAVPEKHKASALDIGLGIAQLGGVALAGAAVLAGIAVMDAQAEQADGAHNETLEATQQGGCHPDGRRETTPNDTVLGDADLDLAVAKKKKERRKKKKERTTKKKERNETLDGHTSSTPTAIAKSDDDTAGQPATAATGSGSAGSAGSTNTAPDRAAIAAAISDSAQDTEVSQWLAAHQLERYSTALATEGYDRLVFLSDMAESDVADLVAAANMKRPHERTFRLALQGLLDRRTLSVSNTECDPPSPAPAPNPALVAESMVTVLAEPATPCEPIAQQPDIAERQARAAREAAERVEREAEALRKHAADMQRKRIAAERAAKKQELAAAAEAARRQQEHEQQLLMLRQQQAQQQAQMQRQLEIQASQTYTHSYATYSGMGGGGYRGLGGTASTGMACKNCSSGRGCRWAGQGRPGHR
eukprot:COSAG02_NODE_2358_length_9064_cov_12.658003_1_plen_520_part_00